MTGWPAVAVTTGLMVVALTGFNIRLFRRIRAARRAAAAKDDGDGARY